MASPNSITVSLEWSKKLKEAGWPQDVDINNPDLDENILPPDDAEDCENSFTYHCSMATLGDFRLLSPEELVHTLFTTSSECWAAPTAEEILRRLPIDLQENGVVRFMKCGYGYAMKQGMVWYEANAKVDFQSKHHQMADSLANAAAAMWCYLKEHNLLPPQL